MAEFEDGKEEVAFGFAAMALGFRAGSLEHPRLGGALTVNLAN